MSENGRPFGPLAYPYCAPLCAVPRGIVGAVLRPGNSGFGEDETVLIDAREFTRVARTVATAWAGHLAADAKAGPS